MESDQNQSQVEVQPRADTQPASLVELVRGKMTHRLYRRGQESHTSELNGMELSLPEASGPKLVHVYERRTRTEETFERYKLRFIGERNPKPGYFDAYVRGDEENSRGSMTLVSVEYYRLPPGNEAAHQ